MFKKWWVRIAISLVALLLIGLMVAWVYLDAILKRGVERVGPAITKTEVRLESVSLSPFSGTGELEDLVVGNPEGYKTPFAAKVGSVALAMKPTSIWGDKVVIRSINIVGPEITFEGGLKGNNLSKLLENVQGTKQQPDTREEQKATTRKLQVDELRLTGGKVHVVADFLSGEPVVVNLPPIHLSGLGQGPDGITPAELTEKVLRVLLEETVKSVAAGTDMTRLLRDAGKGLGTNTAEQLQKAAKGLGDLLKQK